MGQHTPEPWRAGKFTGNNGEISIVSERGLVAIVHPQIERVTRGKNVTAPDAPDPERDANAALMIAAPDLLAALKAFMSDLHMDAVGDWRIGPLSDAPDGRIVMARAAIARVEGGAM